MILATGNLWDYLLRFVLPLLNGFWDIGGQLIEKFINRIGSNAAFISRLLHSTKILMMGFQRRIFQFEIREYHNNEKF